MTVRCSSPTWERELSTRARSVGLVPASKSPSLSSDVLSDMAERAKLAMLDEHSLRYVFGFVQTTTPRRVVRAEMALHGLLAEADVNGTTVVRVRRRSGRYEQSYRSSRMAEMSSACETSPETMIRQLCLHPSKWNDPTEQFLMSLGSDAVPAACSVPAVIRLGRRLSTWWVTYDPDDGLAAMLVPDSRPSGRLP